MDFFLISIILILTILSYIFEISFKSFSKISLAGFLNDLNNDKINKFDFIQKYEMFLNSIRAFSFFLQLILFIYSFFVLENLIPNPINRIILLILTFLFLFNFLLYITAYFNKESILKKLILLYQIPWLFFYPANIIFSSLIKKNPENRENDQDDISEKELEIFFEESTKEGVLEKEDKEMIESVIDFSDTLVKEIMTPRVDMIYVNINTNLNELVKTINRNKKSRYPVISDRIDNIEGIILSKDVFNYLHKKDFNINKILRPAFFIPETMRISELLKELQKSKQKFAVVVDEFGGISGVVTMEDIIEEIVGEIKDEYDEDIEQIVKEKDYFIVKGDTDIDALQDKLNIKIDEDEDYQTVAGLISFKLGKIPDKFDKVIIKNFTFEVINIEKNRIKKIKIYNEKE
jgi:CBS domain containing-hemolysin-like protein